MELIQIFCLTITMTGFLLAITSNYLNFIKIYTLQTIIIFALFFVMYSTKFVDDYLLLTAFIYGITIRVIGIPFTLNHFLTKLNMPFIERKLHINGLYAFIILLGLLFFVALLSEKVHTTSSIFQSSILIIFFGFFTFLNHKKLIGDILAFLFIENGLFLFSMLIIEKVGFYAEINIMVDILMSISILVLSMIKIRSINGNINISEFVNLKE